MNPSQSTSHSLPSSFLALSDSGHDDKATRDLAAGTDPHRPLPLTRLLQVDGSIVTDAMVGDLSEILSAGDLVVLNDAGTLPASLSGRVRSTGAPLEIRLASAIASDDGRDVVDFPSQFRVVLFGEGSWRDDTDTRPAPPTLVAGDVIEIGDGLVQLLATIDAVSGISPRLVDVTFSEEGDALGAGLYAHGVPVQYRHLDAPLSLAQIQTPFASRPWAMEMPSTGRPLSWELLDALSSKGISHAFLTHAAGLSATGDAALDQALPLDERYFVPASTAALIARTKALGGKIIAVGTTVVRALESASLSGSLVAGYGDAKLRLDRTHPLQIVDAILTGIHSPGESHFDLLGAFAQEEDLVTAHQHAISSRYLAHELGDLMLLMGGSLNAAGTRARGTRREGNTVSS